ncbi:MAG: O-antigen ligase family protein, partial [Salibacteraceae bacterium]
MPIYQKLVPIIIVLLVINWLSKGKDAFKIKELFTNVPLLLLISFYSWHAVGMLWSQNTSFGAFDLEIKASFLVLPIVYSAFGRFKAENFENILSSYVLGCLGAILIGVINSVWAYSSGVNPFLDFYSANISPVLHISYFAMYLNLALVIVFYKIIKNEDNFYSWKNAALIFASFVFALATFLSTSRNGFLALLFLLLIVFSYSIVRYRKWLLGISMVLMVWIIASSLLKDIASGKMGLHGLDKVGKVMSAESLSNDESESTGVRILIWKSALELIKESPIIGVGTGDVKDDLISTYKKNDYTAPYKKNYNAHNQYLQTAVALGAVGLLLLLTLFGTATIMSFIRYNYLYLMFSINMAVSCVTESILEVQAGVVFFAFFTVILSPIMNASVNRRFKFLKTTTN